ncbi:MerR family transcriptional regulator [Cyanobium sp. ATX-6F1]|uniref:MerR family transcriptional regulator n=1 Tax=Cyanobium sp. ATX-6F1 TaxID=3137388 RepID=UPI0039BE3428
MVKVSTPADALYGLEELLLVAGKLLGEVISSRTVRLYATQGLIDRPGKEGRSAVYSHRHLLQLVLVRALARRGLSLSAIAPLCVLADADLEQQLELLDGVGAAATVPSPPASRAALDYLQDLQSSKESTPTTDDFPAHLLSKTHSLSPVLGMLSEPLSTQARSERSPSGSRFGGSTREASSRWLRFHPRPRDRSSRPRIRFPSSCWFPPSAVAQAATGSAQRTDRRPLQLNPFFPSTTA